MPSNPNVKMFRSRIINAGVWSISGHGLSQIIRLASNLVMTRLLVPEMFGIMAVANVFLVGLALFSDIGLKQNIIHSKRGDDPLFLNTVWAIQIIRGVIIWVLALIVSGALIFGSYTGWLSGNTVYADPLLPFVISAISFSAVINGFESTRLATSMRQLAQKHITSMEIASQLVGLIAMIIWASIDRSIWALVVGSIVGSTAKLVYSHTLLPGLPNRWEWDSVVFREVLNFGKWIFLSSITGFLFSNGDRLLLGGLVSSETLGIYSITFLMVNAIQLAVSKLSGAVVFPALSEVHRDQSWKLKDTYYKFRMWIDAGILFIVGFLVVAGDAIVDLLYDERFAAAGPMLQVLSLVLVTQRYALADQCYLAIGKPKYMSYLIIVRMIFLYVFVISGFHMYGMDGVLWGIVLSNFASVPASMYLKSRCNILDVKKEIIILPMLMPGAVFGMAVVLLVD
ncbi:MAG: oligosaccharide flippase family protein [Sedimenticola sp.]